MIELEINFLHAEEAGVHKSVVYLIDPDILTIADIYLVCDLANLRLIGIKLEEFPLVYAYLQRYFNDPVFMNAHTKFLLYCETKGKNLELNFAHKETEKKKLEKIKAGK